MLPDKQKIKIAETDEEIRQCYSVMAELRPHISFDDFLPRIKRQMKQSNFKLVYLDDKGIKAVGGNRIAEWLSGGKYLEIEDLATKDGERSKGYGGALFDWIVDYAKRENCDQIKLVSHVKRYGAHRFYLNKKNDYRSALFFACSKMNGKKFAEVITGSLSKV